MQYMGSKNRISKELKPFLERNLNGENWYIEPFVGGANMIDKINYDKRIGADFNEYLIEMWKALQGGWIPPSEITKEDYDYCKNNKDKDKKLSSFIGFLCSFGGKWFGGYAKNSKGDNYAERGSRILTKQVSSLEGVIFKNGSYSEMEIPSNSVIYCDPPYEGTTKYKDDFNHNEFWEWCRQKVNESNFVYVSEYNAPNDFICIWQKEVKTVLNKNDQTSKRVEKLFVHESQLEQCKLN